MNGIIEKLSEHVDFNTRKNIYIQGGYFESDRGVDDFSENTAKLALKLAKYFQALNQEHSVKIGVLVNDLGMVCGTDVCVLRESGDIEKQVAYFYDKFPEFYGSAKTEKHMKNKGLRKIKKIFKRKLDESAILYPILHNETHKDWYHKSELNNDILLFQEREDRWIAKCPSIMAAYYLTCMKEVDSESGTVVIDFCSFSDKDKVLKGAEVALQGFMLGENIKSGSTSIFPILTNDDCSNFIVTSLSSEDF